MRFERTYQNTIHYYAACFYTLTAFYLFRSFHIKTIVDPVQHKKIISRPDKHICAIAIAPHISCEGLLSGAVFYVQFISEFRFLHREVSVYRIVILNSLKVEYTPLLSPLFFNIGTWKRLLLYFATSSAVIFLGGDEEFLL